MSTMSKGAITLPLPANSRIRITGFTNSGWWGQQIRIQPPQGGQELTWTGNGAQENQLVGQCVVGPYAQQEQPITIQMAFNGGDGWQPSVIKAEAYDANGLCGYVVGGQDGGGRSSGPAFWNTLVLIYWAVNY